MMDGDLRGGEFETPTATGQLMMRMSRRIEELEADNRRLAMDYEVAQREIGMLRAAGR